MGKVFNEWTGINLSSPNLCKQSQIENIFDNNQHLWPVLEIASSEIVRFSADGISRGFHVLKYRLEAISLKPYGNCGGGSLLTWNGMTAEQQQ